MKIAILTLPFNTNIGGILQAYALQTVIEQIMEGNSVEILTSPYLPKVPNIFFRPFLYSYRLVLRKRGRYDARLRIEEATYKELKPTWNFMHKNMNLHFINSLKDVKENDFDIIVVGSDQVWRPIYFRLTYDRMADAFLQFTEGWDIKRIAYAASFGAEQWEYNQNDTNECARCLQMFDAVSCREKEGVKFCMEYLNRDDAVLMPDPTMLLRKDDYRKFVKTKKKKEKKLFAYILDMTLDKETVIMDMAKKMKLEPYVFSLHDGKHGIEDWLQQFEEADYVVTDSFHGSVFSIIFGKEFIAYANKDRGMARFTSLLNMFGLEERLVCSLEDYITNDVSSSIATAQEKMETIRCMALKWLEENLGEGYQSLHGGRSHRSHRL